MQSIPKKLVLATRNAGKVSELKLLLEALDVEVLSVADFPGAPEVDETADTLEGNAEKKAREIGAFVGCAVLSDDTGLEVAALDGAPGVYSARYGGEDGNAALNKAKLLKEMEGESDRSARFRTVVCLIDGEHVRFFEGVCDGEIAVAERGEGGFGYDPLFVPLGFDLTFAELSAEEKNTISHRAKALRGLLDGLVGGEQA